MWNNTLLKIREWKGILYKKEGIKRRGRLGGNEEEK